MELDQGCLPVYLVVETNPGKKKYIYNKYVISRKNKEFISINFFFFNKSHSLIRS